MKIQVINKSKHALPEYATGQSAGMDIRANLDEPIVLKPLTTLFGSYGTLISHCLKVLKRKSVHVAGWLLRKASES